MFRPTFAHAALVLSCISPALGCATAEQPAISGNDTTDGGSGGSNATGGSGVSGSVSSSGGKLGGSGSTGVSGSTGTAGTTAHGGTGSGTGGTSSTGGTSATGGTGTTGGTHAGGSAGSSAAGTSSGGSSSAGTTGAAGTTSGGASGTVLFTDDFEDGATTKWVTSGGTWGIVTDGTKAYAQSGTGTGSSLLLSAAGATTWTDQIVEAKIKILAFGGQSTSYFAGIFARYDGSTYYSLLLRSDGKLVIRDGTSSITNAVAASIVAGTTYTVRFELVGSSLKAYLNNVLQASVTDATHTSGGIAVATVNTTAEFDDIKVTTP